MPVKGKNFKINQVDTQYLPGDIGVITNKSLFGKSIEAFIVIDIYGKLFAAEVYKNKILIVPFALHEGKSNIQIYTPIKPYSTAETQKVSDLATSMVFEPKGKKNSVLFVQGLANSVRANTFTQGVTKNTNLKGMFDSSKYYRVKSLSN